MKLKTTFFHLFKSLIFVFNIHSEVYGQSLLQYSENDSENDSEKVISTPSPAPVYFNSGIDWLQEDYLYGHLIKTQSENNQTTFSVHQLIMNFLGVNESSRILSQYQNCLFENSDSRDDFKLSKAWIGWLAYKSYQAKLKIPRCQMNLKGTLLSDSPELTVKEIALSHRRDKLAVLVYLSNESVEKSMHLSLWSLLDFEKLFQFDFCQNDWENFSITNLNWSPDDHFLTTVRNVVSDIDETNDHQKNQMIDIWNTKNLEIQRSVGRWRAYQPAPRWSLDSKSIFVRTPKYLTKIDIKSGKKEHLKSNEYFGRYEKFKFSESPTQKQFIELSDSKTIKVYNPQTLTTDWEKSFSERIYGSSWSPDEKKIALQFPHHFSLFRAENGSPLLSFTDSILNENKYAHNLKMFHWSTNSRYLHIYFTNNILSETKIIDTDLNMILSTTPTENVNSASLRHYFWIGDDHLIGGVTKEGQFKVMPLEYFGETKKDQKEP